MNKGPRYILLVVIILLTTLLKAQDERSETIGKVTYLTSQNVYVRFDDTEGIEVGDTLNWSVLEESVPCLVVKNMSSSSVVCEKIDDCSIGVDEEVRFIKSKKVPQTQRPQKAEEVETPGLARFHGRISAASYSNFSDVHEETHRMMYRLSFHADHINDSKFSAETYLNYRQVMVDEDRSPLDRTNFLNIYNLALRYEPDSLTSLVVGRKINRRASSLGAIDGLQAERYFGKLYAGTIVGFRPDFREYDLNTDLLEFGAYVGLEERNKNIRTSSTLGLLQQNNGDAVDRRYLYFQHSSTFSKNWSLFSSIELDIFNKINNEQVSDPRLTNLFVSVRYRPTRKVNLFLSYDSRKRIMFYETFRTDIERLLADDEARQGLRARVNYRPMRYVGIGASYSSRFQASNANSSDNFNVYFSHSKLPWLDGRIHLSVNQNESNYLRNRIFSIRHSRDLIARKLSADLYYRNLTYTYLNLPSESSTTRTSQQEYYGLQLLWRIDRTLSFSVMGEYSVRPTEENQRLNARLIKRFDTKRKKK
jgi:hypothetical protein